MPTAPVGASKSWDDEVAEAERVFGDVRTGDEEEDESQVLARQREAALGKWERKMRNKGRFETFFRVRVKRVIEHGVILAQEPHDLFVHHSEVSALAERERERDRDRDRDRDRERETERERASSQRARLISYQHSPDCLSLFAADTCTPQGQVRQDRAERGRRG